MKMEITSSERSIILSALIRREADLQSFLSCSAVKSDPEASRSVLNDLHCVTQLIDLVGGLK